MHRKQDDKWKTVHNSFYVDDNKISHVEPKVVSDIINELSKHFGNLTVSRGKKHDYLGMDIEIKDKLVYISMKKKSKKL